MNADLHTSTPLRTVTVLLEGCDLMPTFDLTPQAVQELLSAWRGYVEGDREGSGLYTLTYDIDSTFSFHLYDIRAISTEAGDTYELRERVKS